MRGDKAIFEPYRILKKNKSQTYPQLIYLNSKRISLRMQQKRMDT